jgi:uncharacterized protein (TIGR01777 family)
MTDQALQLKAPHQTILITGGTGFIGQALVAELLKEQHTVIVLTRSAQKAAKKLPASVKIVESLSQIDRSTHINIIINLAGEPIANGRWTARKKQEIWDSRIHITNDLVNFIERLQHKPKVFISGSAIGYYGRAHNDASLTEDTAANDEFTHRLCKTWEDTALQATQYGVRVCLIRTGVVLGSTGGTLQQMRPSFALGLGGKLSTGQQWMSWIHLHDLLAIIFFAINKDTLSGPINATAPTPVNNAEFSRTLAHALHRPCLFIFPAFLLKLLFGEMAYALLLNGQRVIPKKCLDHGFIFRYPTLAKALQEILNK